MSEVKESSVNKMAEELIALSIDIEVREIQVSEMKKQLRKLEGSIVRQMIDNSIDKIGVDGIDFSTLDISNYSLDKSILGDNVEWDNPMFFEFLREVGEGEAIRSRESIHHSTRKAILDGLVKKGVDLPNYINIKGFTKLQYNSKKLKGRVNG